MRPPCAGSPSIYAAPAGEGDWWGSGPGSRWRGGRGPTASINFVTAHDGFTLADLVAYNEKRNEANGEGGADGEAHNLSWNCGEEGPTADGGVARLRSRQVRNMAAALLLAQGVPMLHMGDEYGHTKGGNNNTYCHDGPLNWFDWAAAASDTGGTLRFTRALLRLRRAHPELRREAYVQDGEVEWHGAALGEPDWSDGSRLVALSLRAPSPAEGGLYIAFSTAHVPVTLTLPQWHDRAWRPLIDTAKPAPLDVLAPSDDDDGAEKVQAALRSALSAAAAWTAEGLYSLLPWSMVVLESVPEGLVAAAAAGGAGEASVEAVEALMNASSVRLPRLRGVEKKRRESGASSASSSSASASKMRAEIEAAAAENEKLRAALAEAAAAKKK